MGILDQQLKQSIGINSRRLQNYLRFLGNRALDFNVNHVFDKSSLRDDRQMGGSILQYQTVRGLKEYSGRNFRKPIVVKKEGIEVCQDPLYNKGTAYEHGERDRLNIRGLLPPRHLSMETQIKRIRRGLDAIEDPMLKNIYLTELHDRNETLFHRMLVDNIEELAPIIYTPTVGQVCQEFALRFRRPRGMYFSTYDRGHMQSMIYNWPQKDVHVIVVTDGSRILGLGDLGANGMGIPVGKLALYCAAGGIAPHRVLPCLIDCGTDNQQLLNDPYYIGIQKPRLRGPEFYDMVDEFMAAVRGRYPKALIQFEDFSSDVAGHILEKYRNFDLCFNDDIQGTGCVTLAGLLSALQNQGKEAKDITKERIMIVGAGSAGIGVATTLQQGMIQEGLTKEEARKRFWILDEKGLLGKERANSLTTLQRGFMREGDYPDGLSLDEAIKAVKPTILLGLSAQGGLFKEFDIREMAKHHANPFIFPLSNPTSNAEAKAEDVYRWTDGKAIFASGSPFDPVTYNGKLYTPSQCNNMFIFPGLGLGAVLSGAKIVSDGMLYASAKALSKSLTTEERETGAVFPRVKRIREVSLQVATAVAKRAVEEGHAKNFRVKDMAHIEEIIAKKMYEPVYVPLVEKVYDE